MFADLCFAIAVHEFLLEQHNLHRRFDHSFFGVEHLGNELRMSLNVIRASANNSFKGYLTHMSTERDIFGMFKVIWAIVLWPNPPTATVMLHNGTHYVNNIQDYYKLFDRYGPPSRNRAS